MSRMLPERWSVVSIGDLGQVITGRTPPSSNPEMFGGVYPFITPSDMSYGQRRVIAERTISKVGFSALKRIKVPARSVAVVCIGATIGKVCLTHTDSFTNQQVNSIVVDSESYSPEFVYYLMLSIADELKALAGGAATPIINKSSFCGVSVSVPPRDVQDKVAAILSAYDDLIENNMRRIDILEEMAQRLYREWFVELRFPGYEGADFKESELGLIPASWCVSRIGDSFITVLGGTPSRKKNDYWEGGEIPWIASGKANELRIATPTEYITSLGLKSSSAKLMPEGTTVLAITGATLGQVSILLDSMAANQSVVGVYDASGLRREYIYRHIQFWIWEIIKRASGGAQQHINKDIVNDSLYLEPDLEVLTAFNNLALPIGGEISNLIRKNNNLREQRDLLLPKLISGEIDVSDIPMPT